MPEHTSARPLHDAAGDTVIARFRPPARRRSDVQRNALVKRLVAGRGPLAAVTAPAGYGKTTLLGQWASQDPRPVAWITAVETDNRPRLLAATIASSLRPLAQVPGDPRRIERALAQLPEPVLLVVDSADRLDRDALALLAGLAENLPDGSTMALASRRELRLPLARLRIDGRLTELISTDLAMDVRDARALIEATGVRVSAAEAGSLHRAAEGWPAGIRLAVLSGAGDDAGTDRDVVDYLRSEVLAPLSGPDVEFLTRTAVLEELSAPLCDEVLGRSDSGRRLERLECAGAMLVPLDRHRGAYRLHRMLRQMLAAELELRRPRASAGIAARAAEWYQANDRPEQAIGYALASGDRDHAASLVEGRAMVAFHSGHVALVESWLSRLEGDPLDRRPGLAVLAAWIHALRGRSGAAEECLAAAERGVEAVEILDETTVPRLALLRAAICPDGVDRMQADAQFAVDALDVHSPWRAKALLLTGWAQLLRGMDDEADAVLARAAHASAAGLTNTSSIALAGRAVLAAGRGDDVGADALASDAIERLGSGGLTHRATSVACYAAGARTAAARGRHESAREWLAVAHRLFPQVTRALPWMAVQSRLDAARAHLLLGEDDRAAALCDEADHLLLLRPRLGTLSTQASEVRWASGRRQTADGWASSLTAAELRLLPMLTTHLSFREIADRLFVSRNTVKTQAISVYRKLGASSRSEAVERAAALGLIEQSSSLPGDFIPSG
jgi:LuxR family maltose regulon positive regulatory protein